MNRNITKRMLSLISAGALAISALVYVSCSDDITKGLNNPDPLKLTGTVLGKLLDRCSGQPIKGVRVSLAGKSAAETNSDGSFVFTNVPVNADYSTVGVGTVWDEYEVLMDFTDYNIGKADSLKYPDYKTTTVDVAFTDLNDGDNSGLNDNSGGGEESGSGADTPVHGLVSSILGLEVGFRNTTIMGTVVDGPNFDAVVGATVYLKETDPAELSETSPVVVIKTTTTGANGDYTFANVENGASYTIEAWNATKTMTGTRSVTLICGQNPMLRSQVNTENIVLAFSDNVAPKVTDITPANLSDVAPNTPIVFTFSEPIKQTAYTNTALPKGHSTIIDDITFTFTSLKKAMGPITFIATWDASFDHLTVTPVGQVGSGRYNITYAAGMAAKLTDASGVNALANAGTAIVGDFLNSEQFNYTTSGSATAPATPVLSKDSLIVLVTAVDWNAGSVKLKWTVDETGANPKVKFFEILKKVGNGTFDVLATNVRSSDTTLTINATDMGVAGTNNPRTVGGPGFAVRAISENLVVGNLSNPSFAFDKNLPNVVQCDSIDTLTTGEVVLRLEFNEPLSETQAEVFANYTFNNNSGAATTASGAVYEGFNVAAAG